MVEVYAFSPQIDFAMEKMNVIFTSRNLLLRSVTTNILCCLLLLFLAVTGLYSFHGKKYLTLYNRNHSLKECVFVLMCLVCAGWDQKTFLGGYLATSFDKVIKTN